MKRALPINFNNRKAAMWFIAGGCSVIVHVGGVIALKGLPSRPSDSPLIDSPGVETELFITQSVEKQTAPIVDPLPQPEIIDNIIEPAPVAAHESIVDDLAPIKIESFEPPSQSPADKAESVKAPVIVLTPKAIPTPAIAPSASFAGVKGDRAGRVMYVLDASGAMTTCLPFIKTELEASVSRLIDGQSFQIVMTRRRATEKGAEIRYFSDSKGGYLGADTKTRVTLKDWLQDVSPKWASDPGAGIEAALKQTPDVIFVLTRSIRRSAGDDPLDRSLLARLDKLNPKDKSGKRRTAIKVLQFIDDDPTGVLPEIAREHGDGPESYRVIRPSGR